MGDKVKKRDTNVNRKDKHQYKKFTGNRAEGQGFADKRKRKIQYEYLKWKKKDQKLGKDGQPTNNRHGLQSDGRPTKGQHSFTKAQLTFQKQKEEERRKKTELTARKQEMDKALNKYKDSKRSKYLKLCKRTHKGQPVMKNQIEYLLEKIQKQVGQE